MNANLRRMVSGIAALGIALSGMALGAGPAWATEGGGGDGASASVALKSTDEGTITISGGAIAHTFNGYRLGWLDSLSYDTDEEDSDTDTDEGADEGNTTYMTGYTLVTNTTYKTQIENALDGITDANATETADRTKTLKERYLADKNYCGSDCSGTGEPNPLGWFFANYGSGYEATANWGGDAKDGSNASVLRQFATKVSTAIKGMDSTPADVQPLTSSEEGNKNTVFQGFYLLRDTTTIAEDAETKPDDNRETQSAPILVSTTYIATIDNVQVTFDKDASEDVPHKLGQVSLKNSTPTVTKKVVTDENGATAQNQPDYAVGDTVYYKLTATLPCYTGYATPGRIYKIIDTASAGLNVDAGADDVTRAAGENAVVSVKVVSTDGKTTQDLVKGTDYTVETKSTTDSDAKYEDGQDTTIDFAKYVNLADGTQSKNAKILEGGTVTVILKAKLNKDALISDSGHAQGNPSKDSLTYSNEPEDVTQTHTTPGDEVNVYTYRFRLHKTDKGGEGLAGATFHVSAPGDANKWLAWVVDDEDENAGAWSYVDDEEEATNFTSDNDGNVVGLIDPDRDVEEGNTVNLDRLDSGTYTVKETEAPDGYTQAFLPEFTFTITPNMSGEGGQKTLDNATFSNTTGDNGFVTSSAAITADGNDKGAWQYTVYNAKNLTQLPMTGGAGLAAVIAVGVLLGGAGIAAAVRSRKSNTRAVRA